MLRYARCRLHFLLIASPLIKALGPDLIGSVEPFGFQLQDWPCHLAKDVILL